MILGQVKCGHVGPEHLDRDIGLRKINPQMATEAPAAAGVQG